VNRTSAVLAIVACVALGQNAAVKGPQKAVLRLMVWPTELQAKKQGGDVSFHLDVSADKGFGGTVSGSISISEPANPGHVELAEGLAGGNLSFKLAAGQKISDAKALVYRIRTAANNSSSGTLIYSVFLNGADDQFTAEKSAQQVRVKVTEDVPK
jgi:hypothetical protein